MKTEEVDGEEGRQEGRRGRRANFKQECHNGEAEIQKVTIWEPAYNLIEADTLAFLSNVEGFQR